MRFRVYQEGRFASGAVAAGRTLTVYEDEAMATEATLYAAATGTTEVDNPYTVPATGIIDFWLRDSAPWGLAQGDATARPLRVLPTGMAMVSVTDFGAKGDGVTNDAAAIQAACDAAPIVYFPPADSAYIVNTTVTCVDNYLVGPNRANNNARLGMAKLVTWVNGDQKMLYFTGDSGGMEGLSIQGDNEGSQPLVTFGNGTDWMADGRISNCWFSLGSSQLVLNKCQGFFVNDCVFDGSADIGIALNGAPNLLFANNRVCQADNTGIKIYGTGNYNLSITGNLIDCSAGPPTSHYPTYADNWSRHSGIWMTDCFGAVIDANVFNYNWRQISMVDGTGDEVRDITVSNNLFTAPLAESVYISACDRITLTNNHFVPYHPSDADVETEYLETPIAHVFVTGAADRVVVNGGSLVGNTYRTVGVQFGASVTNSAVDMLMWEGLTPVSDSGTGNRVGVLVPAAASGVTATTAEANLLDDSIASITLAPAAGGANVCEVTITVKDAAGTAIDNVHVLEVYLSDSSVGAGLTATTASGTVTAKAASGAVLSTLTDKKHLRVSTLATGVFVLEITDTAKTGFYVCAVNPLNGKVFASAALTGSYGA